jgi:VWFA-related protein
MRLRPGWTSLAAICLIASAHASGPQAPAPPPPQDPQQPVPIFRAGTAVVRVDVTVTGRGDEPVADLTAADFEVEEDDVPQTVSTAQFLRVDGQRTSDLNEPLEIRSFEHAKLEAARDDVRLVAIFLDDYHIDKKPEITLPLREALIKFVNLFGPNDLLVLMEPLTTLDGLKYTRSKNDIINRIKTFEGRRGEVYPVKSAVEEMQLTQRNWGELRAGVTLDGLNALATQLGGLREGRKSIVFVSQGPPIQLGSPNDQRLNDAVKAANRGNVTIHVVDPRPLGFVGFGGADVLRRIAADTGGRAILNTNDPSSQLKGVLADASAYYLVGYTPTRTTNDGKFHKITVKVQRRGTRVTARRGYWAASEKELTAAAEAKATPDNVALTTALTALADTVTGSAVTVWTGTSRGDDGRTKFTVTWEANTQPAGRDKPARLEIQPVTEDNKPSMDAKVIAGALGEIPIVAHFEFPPGRQRIRMTSMTSAGDTIDRWVQTVTIPKLASEAIDLATPRFLRARSMPEFRAIEANPAPAPTASRRFRPNERVVVEIECYGPGESVPELKFDLLNGKGDVLRVLDAPVLANGRLRMVLPVGSLAPSVYVLRVQASQGEQSAQQLAAFRVAP